MTDPGTAIKKELLSQNWLTFVHINTIKNVNGSSEV